MLILLTLISIVVVSVLIYGAMSLVSVIGGAQLVTTPKAVWPLVVDLVQLKSGERFVELGSGLGYVSGCVARSTKAHVVGIDLAPLWVWLARIIQRDSGAQFCVGSVFTTDLSDVDVIYCYLLPRMLTKLEEKFATVLKPGSRVITYGFPLPNRRASKTIVRTKDHGPLFLYRL